MHFKLILLAVCISVTVTYVQGQGGQDRPKCDGQPYEKPLRGRNAGKCQQCRCYFFPFLEFCERVKECKNGKVADPAATSPPTTVTTGSTGAAETSNASANTTAAPEVTGPEVTTIPTTPSAPETSDAQTTPSLPATTNPSNSSASAESTAST
ncbi:unnamed protein product [Allacma fusca]|uniref:Uncharacterized protein n=1 Tax=Allacma fusca TaxID=39272 RepID=A0A8J2Q444_9HEXA|nr:unnamed protein product [Allacma fusca]